ncbi:MAG TPA: PASTA domain-containing protein, partial [Actinomycetes bacterium]|nr:PASTA domain-containing protein [Actinomycetes bacterium]
RADVYALGVVAWECVCGRPPFEGEPSQVVQQHLGGRVPPPSAAVGGVPEQFDAAVSRATDPDPTGRYLRASDFAAAMGAPRRRRVDETLRATTLVPEPGPDTGAGWAPAAGAAAAPTEGPAPGPGAETRSLDGWPTVAGGATRPPPGPPQAPLRPRPTTGRVPKTRVDRAKGRRGRILAALLVVGLLAVGLATRAGGLLGGSVRVPEVVGLEVAEATRDLQDRGLRVRVDGPVASDHVAEGLVATQSVAGGDKARRRDTVVLRPSLGITLPDLARRPAGSATGRLRELGIRFRQEQATSLTIPKGGVIGTRPRRGTVVKADQVVTVVVSAGKPQVQVPEVAGRGVRRATGELTDAHLRVRAVLVFDDDMPKNRAVGTDPGPGTRVTWGSTVTLRVSKGPDLVEVPEVVGLPRDEAERRLREAGLGWRYVLILPVGSNVVDQSPEPGERAKRGSEVRLLLNLL